MTVVHIVDFGYVYLGVKGALITAQFDEVYSLQLFFGGCGEAGRRAGRKAGAWKLCCGNNKFDCRGFLVVLLKKDFYWGQDWWLL